LDGDSLQLLANNLLNTLQVMFLAYLAAKYKSNGRPPGSE